ncbi:hypothetical protein M8818_005469 [Zalaria obscura]|uniref:Uncharacterized protein n=1 Tax=Zalaria obscura TaxID=2024903 RepID=A0ACC3S812_9PEZI
MGGSPDRFYVSTAILKDSSAIPHFLDVDAEIGRPSNTMRNARQYPSNCRTAKFPARGVTFRHMKLAHVRLCISVDWLGSIVKARLSTLSILLPPNSEGRHSLASCSHLDLPLPTTERPSVRVRRTSGTSHRHGKADVIDCTTDSQISTPINTRGDTCDGFASALNVAETLTATEGLTSLKGSPRFGLTSGMRPDTPVSAIRCGPSEKMQGGVLGAEPGAKLPESRTSRHQKLLDLPPALHNSISFARLIGTSLHRLTCVLVEDIGSNE